LPALIRDLQIDYTALSLVAPEKVKFRYKLEGHDTDWQDVGTRRQAFYNDLPPRNYRFRVRASNNSGVWNEAGDSLDFSVDPCRNRKVTMSELVEPAVTLEFYEVSNGGTKLAQEAGEFSSFLKMGGRDGHPYSDKASRAHPCQSVRIRLNPRCRISKGTCGCDADRGTASPASLSNIFYKICIDSMRDFYVASV
jgi:hypothetical protein